VGLVETHHKPTPKLKVKPNTFPSLFSRLARFAIVVAAGAFTTANAQVGPGWTQYSPTKKIHLDGSGGLQTFNWSSYQSVDSPISADYQYTSSTDTERFRIIDNRSNRSEIRLQNEYSSGRRQFQGYVTFSSPLENESLMQIFGSTSGATLAMTRGYASSNGHITVTGTGGTVWGDRTIATNCYGVELKVNVVHSQDNYVQWYVNGSLQCQQDDPEPGVTNYHKYGCYGTLNTGSVTVYWRACRFYQDGYPPKVELYQHTSYGGWKASFVCGDYTASDIVAAGGLNDDASSIKVPSGYRVTLYTGDNFTGTAIVKTSDDSSLIDDGINDQVSSMKITVN
jgi:hypothetical protein